MGAHPGAGWLSRQVDTRGRGRVAVQVAGRLDRSTPDGFLGKWLFERQDILQEHRGQCLGGQGADPHQDIQAGSLKEGDLVRNGEGTSSSGLSNPDPASCISLPPGRAAWSHPRFPTLEVAEREQEG